MSTGLIILAGGKSSRMGTNKALLPMAGEPNIQRIRNELRNATGDSIVIVANDPEPYQFLGETIVPDRYPGKGPLAGIQSGLMASIAEWNLVSACDMPFASAAAARFLIDMAVHSSVDAVVPVIHGQLHPLFAVYRRSSAEPIEDMLKEDRLRMMYLLEQLRVRQVAADEFPTHIDVERVFYNMNRPQDWEEATQIDRNEG